VEGIKHGATTFAIHSPNPKNYLENGISKEQFLEKTNNIHKYVSDNLSALYSNN
jgi:hypothetical protein